VTIVSFFDNLQPWLKTTVATGWEVVMSMLSYSGGMNANNEDKRDPYSRTSGGVGKLKLKGKAASALKRKRQERALASNANSKDEEAIEGENADSVDDIPLVEGTGRMVTSGTTVQGFESQFKTEIEVGDNVLVHHPKSLLVESSVVLNILSQRAMTINAPFSSDLVSTTSFHIKKDSIRLKRQAEAAMSKPDGPEEESLDSSARLDDQMSLQLQNKLKKQKTVASVREKTGMWGYKIVSKKLKGDVGPGELLTLRTKQGRDKYCW